MADMEYGMADMGMYDMQALDGMDELRDELDELEAGCVMEELQDVQMNQAPMMAMRAPAQSAAVPA